MYIEDEAIRTRLAGSLDERSVRMAVLIIHSFKNMMDMIDEQSPETLESLLDFAQQMQLPDSPARKDRYAVRAAMIEYITYALRQSEERERRLVAAITGRDP
jgi:hypothetical protein